MEGSGFFNEAGKRAEKKAPPMEEEEREDMTGYAFPPEIEITRLQHRIEEIADQLKSLKENDEKLEARAKAASDRLTGVNLNGKKSLIDIARTLNNAIEEEKLQLTAHRKKLGEEKLLLQGKLDEAFKRLPPKSGDSVQ